MLTRYIYIVYNTKNLFLEKCRATLSGVVLGTKKTTTFVWYINNTCQVQEFDHVTRNAQHPKGSTWTEKYGNLSLSCDQSSSHAAEQRSGNTRFVGTAAACASALCPPLLESNGEATVVAPVLAHRSQEKRPILDIFASSVHLKSPKRMKSGVDMIWDRMFGANSLDLSLHKPRLELNAEEKKAQKTAKIREQRWRQQNWLAFVPIMWRKYLHASECLSVRPQIIRVAGWWTSLVIIFEVRTPFWWSGTSWMKIPLMTNESDHTHDFLLDTYVIVYRSIIREANM